MAQHYFTVRVDVNNSNGDNSGTISGVFVSKFINYTKRFHRLWSYSAYFAMFIIIQVHVYSLFLYNSDMCIQVHYTYIILFIYILYRFQSVRGQQAKIPSVKRNGHVLFTDPSPFYRTF